MLGARDAFFRRGLDGFNESGTESVERQSLTISVNTGAVSSVHSSNSVEITRFRGNLLHYFTDVFL